MVGRNSQGDSCPAAQAGLSDSRVTSLSFEMSLQDSGALASSAAIHQSLVGLLQQAQVKEEPGSKHVVNPSPPSYAKQTGSTPKDVPTMP